MRGHPPYLLFHVSIMDLIGGGGVWSRTWKNPRCANNPFIVVKRRVIGFSLEPANSNNLCEQSPKERLQAEIQTDRVTECQCAISRDQKEEMLAPIWGGSLWTCKLCVLKEKAGTRNVHRGSPFISVSSPAVSTFILHRWIWSKVKRQNGQKINNGLALQ